MPVEQRIANVSRFLNDIDSSLTYDIVPITDAFGPTSTDPKIDVSYWSLTMIHFFNSNSCCCSVSRRLWSVQKHSAVVTK